MLESLWAAAAQGLAHRHEALKAGVLVLTYNPSVREGESSYSRELKASLGYMKPGVKHTASPHTLSHGPRLAESSNDALAHQVRGV